MLRNTRCCVRLYDGVFSIAVRPAVCAAADAVQLLVIEFLIIDILIHDEYLPIIFFKFLRVLYHRFCHITITFCSAGQDAYIHAYIHGETYTSSLPTGINAGTYTVYMREGDSDPVVITVTIAKADVVNIIAPVAPSPVTRGGEGPADASEEVSSPVTTSEATLGKDGEEEPAYAAWEEPDEVVFEDLS